MKKITVISIFIIFVQFLSACSITLPSTIPELEVNYDEKEFNTYIKITAPKDLNTFKSGESISLEVVNLSDNECFFDITKDILIFKYENQKWEKITDKMVNIGETTLALAASGTFPMDKQIVGVLPDIETKQSIELRIILLARAQTGERDTKTIGAFVDVQMKP